MPLLSGDHIQHTRSHEKNIGPQGPFSVTGANLGSSFKRFVGLRGLYVGPRGSYVDLRALCTRHFKHLLNEKSLLWYLGINLY